MKSIYFWLILFYICLAYDFFLERQFIFIYYTIWTFTLQTIYFTLIVMKKPSAWLYPVVFAPSIVVGIGFWLVIAPTRIGGPKPDNGVFILVTHGANVVAMLTQYRPLDMVDMWKPILYTFVYNVFLACYVTTGGRSVSGRLPYWYARYDVPVGWVFACLAMLGVAIVHAVASRYGHTQTQLPL